MGPRDGVKGAIAVEKKTHMERNNRLVQKTFNSVLVIRVLSMVSAITCVMIDSMITGKFLGSDAVASMGLLSPVTTVCNLIGPLFGPGTGIVCSKYMGMAKLDRVNQVFSLVMTALLSIGTMVAVALFFTSPLIADGLGGKTNDPAIVGMITDYLRGYSIGLPFMILTLVLSGLMVMDNDRPIGFISVFVTLIADVVFDLLNVTVFHGGMFGMAIATSLSNILGFLTVLLHFLKKKRVLHYKPVGMKLRDIGEVIKNGVPNAISSGSNALRTLVFNALLLVVATKTEVSALSVTNSIFSVVIAASLGFYGATSTICSLFYGEGDRKSVVAAFGFSRRAALIVYGLIMAVLLIFAEGIAGCFLQAGDASELAQAAAFTRFMAVEYFLMSISYSFSGSYQGTGRAGVNYLLVALREAVFPVASVLILGAVFGLRGMGIGFVTAGILSFLFCFIMPAIINRRLSFKPSDLLLLKKDFGSKPEDTFEASVQDMQGVVNASEAVMRFCRDRGRDQMSAFFVALFSEEILGNVIHYGYEEKKQKNADLRVVVEKDQMIIRIRDDGKPFDPVEWYQKNHPTTPESGIGIRIVMELAKDVTYIPAMDLNNLRITI